ncbi:HalOD1 output domain-containing protein [Haladaptatus sp. SPP-AMP-3]|uniref:HalOD1 output domain-containing protein n=1 Tax=Haladaptatus sp. SPP-AMP-3 TaxID=3121295 RepID=UPI003C2AB61F
MSVTASSQSLDGLCANRASAVALEVLVQYDDIDLDETGLRLYDVVDPEALDSLFYHQEESAPSVEFKVCDATVHVWQSDGEIRARVNDERD